MCPPISRCIRTTPCLCSICIIQQICSIQNTTHKLSNILYICADRAYLEPYLNRAIVSADNSVRIGGASIFFVFCFLFCFLFHTRSRQHSPCGVLIAQHFSQVAQDLLARHQRGESDMFQKDLYLSASLRSWTRTKTESSPVRFVK